MGGGRKLISLWLCSLALAACTDTLDEAAVPKPLSVAVNARDITARAPIHGTALPDASNIGISLVAEDGTPYDGVTYDNLKYTAAGTAPDQSWSTPNVPTLSSSPAKLVAYYPWAENTDYSAVPVETDTQTDYMYSQWLTGLSNANPNANIVMKHALTAVRVALVKGDFTADVDVSSVSVKSPAFATAGAMDATTGALSALTGIGDAVTVTADFPLTAQATNVEVMAVPDVSVSSGVTTVTTQIGDRKYSVNINFTESYKQGYIYTYTLTLNNTGMEVTSVAVTPWQDGSETEGELAVTYGDDEYVVKIFPMADSYTFTHNLVDFVGTVNWGDGTTSEYTTATSYPRHTYATVGEYTVVAAGIMTGIRTYTNNSGWTMNASPIITDIIHIGAEMGITDMTGAFTGQQNITMLRDGIFDGLTEVESFDFLFSALYYGDEYKMNILNIPEGLFDKCVKAKSFSKAFYGNGSILIIPERMFDNCPEVTDFSETFRNCTGLTSIPAGLFDDCTEVEDFSFSFSGCKGIMEIPTGLFDNNTKVTDFSGTFYECSGIIEIPGGLFDKCTEVTSFDGTFYGCTKVTSVPAGLFDNNPLVWTFSDAFAGCTGLTSIPEGLFDNCTEVTTFQRTFRDCTGLLNIPTRLFDNNTKVTSFSVTFYGCTALTGESPYTTINVDGTDVKVHLYERSSYPDYFTAPTSYTKAFCNCTGLTDYTEITTAGWN